MITINLLPNANNPYTRCLKGCTNGVCYSVVSPMTKGRHKGQKRLRLLCQEHAAQVAEKHGIPLPIRV